MVIDAPNYWATSTIDTDITWDAYLLLLRHNLCKFILHYDAIFDVCGAAGTGVASQKRSLQTSISLQWPFVCSYWVVEARENDWEIFRKYSLDTIIISCPRLQVQSGVIPLWSAYLQPNPKRKREVIHCTRICESRYIRSTIAIHRTVNWNSDIERSDLTGPSQIFWPEHSEVSWKLGEVLIKYLWVCWPTTGSIDCPSILCQFTIGLLIFYLFLTWKEM